MKRGNVKRGNVKRGILINVLASAMLLSSAIAIAQSEVLDLWMSSRNGQSAFKYFQDGFGEWEVHIDPFVRPGGSSSEDLVDLRFRLSRYVSGGSGSEGRWQHQRYIATVFDQQTLPAREQLYRANRRWQKTSSRPSGRVRVDVGSREVIKGEVFGGELHAFAVER